MTDSTSTDVEYFFALNLRQNLRLLPTLLGSIIEAIRFLGPTHCALSIVEGNSPDGTGEVLEALYPHFDALGTAYIYRTTPIDPSQGKRIEKLSRLRNAALRPIYDNPDMISNSSTVIFLNDVAACAEDILELVLQKRRLGADMVCAMDWEYWSPLAFRDIWVSRGISGDSFIYLPDNMSLEYRYELMWNEPEARLRLHDYRPFQVFSCWNGGVAFRAKPLLDGLRFRGPNQEAGECTQGEPQVFCKDLWFRGYGKIAVVPSVNLGYTSFASREIKRQKGSVSTRVQDEHDVARNQIDWSGPPDNVKCIEPWTKQWWQPWNATLSSA